MPQGTQTRVVNCIATITRYPTSLLSVDADLDNDLGIDSVKRLEIVAALCDEFGIELRDQERDPSIRTIGHLTQWIEDALARDTMRDEAARLEPEPVPPPAVAGRNGRMAPTHTPLHSHVRYDAPPPSHHAPRDSVAHMLTAPRGQSGLPGGDEMDADEMGADEIGAEERLPSTGSRTLEGRVALVTGSGRGVGRTIARTLAARGATVVVNSFHSREQGEQVAAEIVAQGGSAVHIWGSVANPEHVRRIFDQIEQQFGYLDMLICNASDGKIGPFLELTWEDWERAFRTNVAGHHQCAVRSAELMRPRGGGSIVTLSAVGAHGFINGLGSQGVAKAAVESLTRYLACELGRSGIRVNCVVGGPVYGDLLDQFPDAAATRNHWESMTADGELCSPMDLAETIAFLVSDQASGIHGAIWTVDHGFSANADGRPLHNGPLRSAVPKDVPLRSAPPRNGESYPVPPHDIPPHDIPPHNVPPHNVPPRNVPPHNVPPHNVPPHNVPPHNGQPHNGHGLPAGGGVPSK